MLNEAPWLGRCTGVGEGVLDVVWMEGGWRTQWKDARIRKGRKLIPRKDTISKDSTILYDIELRQIAYCRVLKRTKYLILAVPAPVIYHQYNNIMFTIKTTFKI